MEDLTLKDVGEYEPVDVHWVASRHRELEDRDHRQAEHDEHMIKLNYIQQALGRISRRLDEIAAARKRL